MSGFEVLRIPDTSIPVKRFPKDADLDFPVAHLRGTEYILFNNGVVAYHDEESSSRYIFDYHHPSEVDVSLLDIPNYDSIRVKWLNVPTNKFLITLFFLGVFLIISNFNLSIHYIYPTWIPPLISLFLFIIATIIFTGIDYYIFQYYNPDYENCKTIKIKHKRRSEPITISPNTESWKMQLLNFHNYATRFSFVVLCLAYNQNAFDENATYLIILFSNLSLYVFIVAFSPVLLIKIIPRLYNKNIKKIPSLEIERFYEKLRERMEYVLLQMKTPLQELLDIGKETRKLEFKASYWFDSETKEKNLLLRDAVIKEIAGFLNTTGGDLLIGFADEDLSMTGYVDEDIKLHSNPTKDGLERAIDDALRKYLKSRDSLTNSFDVKIDDFDKASYIRVNVPMKATKPVYAQQVERQKQKLQKYKERNPGMNKNDLPDNVKEEYYYRFVRRGTKTEHVKNDLEWEKETSLFPVE